MVKKQAQRKKKAHKEATFTDAKITRDQVKILCYIDKGNLNWIPGANISRLSELGLIVCTADPDPAAMIKFGSYAMTTRGVAVATQCKQAQLV